MHIQLASARACASSASGSTTPLSTLADQVGHGTFSRHARLFHLIERHVLAAERIHGDDTTIRILAKGKCTAGRIWSYIRDDRRFRRACAAGGGLYYARATGGVSTRRSIWPPSPASCNPIATTASSRCSTRRRRYCRSRRRFALPMRGRASSTGRPCEKRPGRPEGQTHLPDRARGGQAP